MRSSASRQIPQTASSLLALATAATTLFTTEAMTERGEHYVATSIQESRNDERNDNWMGKRFEEDLKKIKRRKPWRRRKSKRGSERIYNILHSPFVSMRIGSWKRPVWAITLFSPAVEIVCNRKRPFSAQPSDFDRLEPINLVLDRQYHATPCSSDFAVQFNSQLIQDRKDDPEANI